MNFEGIWTPVVTPFNSDGTVNLEAFRELLDKLIAEGIHGVIIGGTSGEYYALTNAERKQLFDVAIDQVGGRVPLLAGINATTTAECFDYGHHAKTAGFDGILVPAPYYCQPAQDELIRHVETIDEALDLPIMLYNFPDRTGVPMDWEFMAAVRQRPNVQAIKESTGSIERLHVLANEYAQDIQLCCGMDDQVLEFFAWGAPGWVGGASNFLAPEHVALYEACVVEKDFIKGRKLAQAILPVLNTLEQGGKFCQYVKYGCELAGIDVGTARAPLQQLNQTEKAAFKQVYDTLVAQR